MIAQEEENSSDILSKSDSDDEPINVSEPKEKAAKVAPEKLAGKRAKTEEAPKPKAKGEAKKVITFGSNELER